MCVKWEKYSSWSTEIIVCQFRIFVWLYELNYYKNKHSPILIAGIIKCALTKLTEY